MRLFNRIRGSKGLCKLQIGKVANECAFRIASLLAFACAAALLASCVMAPTYEPVQDREAIRKVVQSNIKAMQTCYEQAIDARPGAEGKAIAHWEILPDGSVQNARFDELHPTLEGGRECWLKEIRSMKFGAVPEADIADVTYPFFFSERATRP